MVPIGVWQPLGTGLLVMSVAAAALPASAQSAAGSAGSTVTFARDVAPIFQAKCEVCHLSLIHI